MMCPSKLRFLGSALFLSGIAIILLASCGSRTVTSFGWSSPEGKALAFFQSEGFPEGKENSFSPGREINIYSLKEELASTPGYMLAAEFSLHKDDLVVGFSLGPEARKLGTELRFAGPRGRSRFYLSIPAGTSLKALKISLFYGAGSAQAEGVQAQGTEEEWARLESLAFVPSFRGFETLAAGYRISDKLVTSRKDAATAVWTLEKPFEPSAGPGTQVLVIRYDRNADADIVVEFGDSVLARCMSSKKEIRIPASAFSSATASDSMKISAPDAVGLSAVYIESLPEKQARLADPGVLLLGKGPGEGEDYNWYRWDLLPSVIMFDFKDYGIQDDYLKRLAFFVEKKGFVGRLAPDAEIIPLHGWNAHDYKTEDIARFFSLAESEKFPLNEKELRLRDFLLEQGLLEKKVRGYGSKEGAIISISRESPGYLRRTFLTHESTHAIFFADQRYRKLSMDLWASMPKEEKWFWLLYFGWMNYDTTSSYLMASEVQAYLIQQPPRRAKEYFTKTLVDRLLENHPELEEKLASYMEEFGESFESRARTLDAWLRSTYGFGAGTTYFVR